MDDINGEFGRTDVALVIGANDVTNPAARRNPNSPIYGMPILNVDSAKSVIVLKRGMSPGFAGIENELYYDARTAKLFGDAKSSVGEITEELKACSGGKGGTHAGRLTRADRHRSAGLPHRPVQSALHLLYAGGGAPVARQARPPHR
ncbi:NAD(P)(+) transhydrogenase (Re/Si-specific) subunit beta [Streptomyces sp. NPDC058045]|uniref:NAD(P)(+) transhydrogenase (Re/Si-specific) subunit beta n=1 Tax=Streptomyces sp. NPDC058045 TaxID=3346311 RepID=UPI0036F15BC7